MAKNDKEWYSLSTDPFCLLAERQSILPLCHVILYIDRKTLKIFAKKFGGKEKLSTFAIPNENNAFETTFPNSSVG